jgi:predicted MFS family arabinose efflux permease
MATYVSTIALFIIDLFRFDERQLGMFMLVVGLFISFNQAVVSKWCIGKIGTYRTLQLGMLLSIFGFISITLTDQLWMYISLYYVLNLGIALCAPTLNALLAKHASPQEAGEVMGIAESIGSMSNAIFPLVGAAIYGAVGSQLYWGVAALPLLGLLLSYGTDGEYEEK